MVLTCQSAPIRDLPYCDYQLDPASRALDLAQRLNVTELATVLQTGTTGASWNMGVPRLGVPPLRYVECNHGIAFGHEEEHLNSTLFPASISTARAFSVELVRAVGRAIAYEVRANFNANISNSFPWCYAPVVNVCRDPRWGRCQEGWGEDPNMNGLLGGRYVQALQTGEDPRGVMQVAATCKHFDAHTGPEDHHNTPWSWGPGPEWRGYFNSNVSYRDQVETFYPAFEACVRAGAAAVMCSYNAVNGTPSCANRGLLQGTLRDEWGFKGVVVSDCGAINNIRDKQYYANTTAAAVSDAISAGVDMNCGSAYGLLVNLTANGTVPIGRLREAAARALEVYVKVGVLDPPELVSYNLINKSVIPKHDDLARNASREAIVLLQNRDGALPLDVSRPRSVLLLGPCADEPRCGQGDYHGNLDQQPVVTLATGLRAALVPHQWSLTVIPGCDDLLCSSTAGFEAAADAAAAADLVIFAGGNTDQVESEGVDRPSLQLPGWQPELLAAAAGAIKNISRSLVVVAQHGASLVLPPAARDAAAVLSLGYGGKHAGSAFADVMTGAYSPSGRLVDTWYQHTWDLPKIDNYDMRAGNGRTCESI